MRILGSMASKPTRNTYSSEKRRGGARTAHGVASPARQGRPRSTAALAPGSASSAVNLVADLAPFISESVHSRLIARARRPDTRSETGRHRLGVSRIRVSFEETTIDRGFEPEPRALDRTGASPCPRRRARTAAREAPLSGTAEPPRTRHEDPRVRTRSRVSARVDNVRRRQRVCRTGAWTVDH